MILPSDVLRRDGWCQGVGTDRAGRRCAIGAISATFSDDGHAAFDFRTAIYMANPGFGIAQWNDTPGRTAQEVIALFEKVEYKLGLRVLDEPKPPPTMEDLIEPFKEKEMAWRASGGGR